MAYEGKPITFTETHRMVAMVVFNAMTLFVAVLYLGGGFLRATVLAGFALIATSIGFGRRWIFRAGLVAAALAIAVSFGFPAPNEWAGLFNESRSMAAAMMQGPSRSY